MRNYALAVGIATAAALTAGCSALATTAPSSAASSAASAQASALARTTVPTAPTRYCAAAQLRLSIGPQVSEVSQQHTLVVELHNTADFGCNLRGYPEIELSDRLGTRLAFTDRRRGDEMITGKPSVLVTLSPGGVAYAAVNQSTCDNSPLADWRKATRIDVTPPGTGKPLSAELHAYPTLNYCGDGQTGNELDITPIEPTLAAIHYQPVTTEAS